MRKRGLISISCLLFLVAPIVWIYAFRGVYGINVVLRRGGSIWATINPTIPASHRPFVSP